MGRRVVHDDDNAAHQLMETHFGCDLPSPHVLPVSVSFREEGEATQLQQRYVQHRPDGRESMLLTVRG